MSAAVSHINMKIKNVFGLAGLVILQSAFALSQCPAEAKRCGPNPFYILSVGFSQVCSEKYPETAPGYKAAIAKFVAENPKAYAKLDSDPEFLKKLDELKVEMGRLDSVELAKECKTFLQAQERQPTHPEQVNE